LDTVGKVLFYTALPVALIVWWLVESRLRGSRLRTRFVGTAAACLALATFLMFMSFSWAIARRGDLGPEGVVPSDGLEAVLRSMAELPLPLPAAAVLFAALGVVLVLLSLRSRGASIQFPFRLVRDVMAKGGAQGYAALTPTEKILVCVWTLDRDVEMNGLMHFYIGGSSEVITDAPGALRAIGADHAASIVDRANQLFGPYGPPADADARAQLLDDSVEDELEALTAAFRESGGDNLKELLAGYLTSPADGRLTSASS
jgi:hypothetical protein